MVPRIQVDLSGLTGNGKMVLGKLGPGQSGPIVHFLGTDSWALDNLTPMLNCLNGARVFSARLSGAGLSRARLSGAQIAWNQYDNSLHTGKEENYILGGTHLTRVHTRQ